MSKHTLHRCLPCPRSWRSTQAAAVKAFLAASAEGFRLAAASPAEAADLFVQQVGGWLTGGGLDTGLDTGC